MSSKEPNCSVYKSNKKDLMYLYVGKTQGLEPVPDELLAQFGSPEWVLDIELNAERNLATENVNTVMNNLQIQGYHLQMPPARTVDPNAIPNHKKPLA